MATDGHDQTSAAARAWGRSFGAWGVPRRRRQGQGRAAATHREESALNAALTGLSQTTGIGIDIALGGMPFEEAAIGRASLYEFAAGVSLRTAATVDLAVDAARSCPPHHPAALRHRGRLGPDVERDERLVVAQIEPATGQGRQRPERARQRPCPGDNLGALAPVAKQHHLAVGLHR